jgi:hypothetical protein
MIGKKGYEYILGKESGVATIRIFLKRLGLEATEEEMRKMLEIVKEESNIVKGPSRNLNSSLLPRVCSGRSKVPALKPGNTHPEVRRDERSKRTVSDLGGCR